MPERDYSLMTTDELREQMDLANVYAEDGALATAAAILEAIAKVLRSRA